MPNQGVNLVERPEQRARDDGEEAVVDGQAKARRDLVEAVLKFRTREQPRGEFVSRAGRSV